MPNELVVAKLPKDQLQVKDHIPIIKRNDPIEAILHQNPNIALLLGNGINRYSNRHDSSWDDLLSALSEQVGLQLTKSELQEMSNTELYDLLDLAKPKDDRSDLQKLFCQLMREWTFSGYHSQIVKWAIRNSNPIITVNFDENLSKSADAEFFRQCGRTELPKFTAYYPWRSYFGLKQISNPDKEFAIWHAHGMMRYSQSIRLGLTHYMGSVQRARSWIYGTDNSLISFMQGKNETWRGMNTWLQALFFKDIMIFGFGFNKDETFLRWLFFERARLYKRFSSKMKKAWFVVEENSNNINRKAFFERIGVKFIVVGSHSLIYESKGWES